MEEASRRTGHEAKYCAERAYGVYVGWKVLVTDNVEPSQVIRDENNLQKLLADLSRTPFGAQS